MTDFCMGNPTLSLALNGFTSEFEMGSGGSRSPWSPGKLTFEKLVIIIKCLTTSHHHNSFGIRKKQSYFYSAFYLTCSSYHKTTWVLYDQASRSISTGQLHTLLHFHIQPINVVDFNKPLGTLRSERSHLRAGFPLRCFQRLSFPYLATRQCHWHDNRYTRGTFTPVLSY